jgi:hypothetical protein
MMRLHRLLTTLLGALLVAGCGSGKPKGPPPLLEDSEAAKIFLQDAGVTNSAASPYIRGQIAVVNRTRKILEKDVQRLLPGHLKATTRDDVETVVWLDWSTQQASARGYSVMVEGKERAVPALYWVADVTVVDWKRKLLLGGTRISGKAPSDRMTPVNNNSLLETGGVVGTFPCKEVADYLAEVAAAIAVPK